MKKAITLCLASVLLLATTIPARAENSQIAGVWRATMHDQPCILMNIHDNQGQLGGNIIFYLLKLENGSWHATGSDPIPLIHPRIEVTTWSLKSSTRKRTNHQTISCKASAWNSPARTKASSEMHSKART